MSQLLIDAETNFNILGVAVESAAAVGELRCAGFRFNYHAFHHSFCHSSQDKQCCDYCMISCELKFEIEKTSF